MIRSTAARSLLLGCVGWAALAGAASAQSGPAPAGDPKQAATLDDIIVTGAPFGVSQQATTLATTVMDEETLATAPASSLGDLVNGLPGVRSTDFAPGASRPVIRGLSGSRVQVLTNGIGQIDASSVSPDHAVATDPSESTRIEIVRGPATLAYGGSAIGGVVNIIDDRIPTDMPDGIDGAVSTQASSVDDGRAASGRVTFAAGPFAFNIDGGRAEAPGDARAPGRTQPNSWSQLDTWGVGGSYIGSRGFIGASYKDMHSEYGTVAEPDVFIVLDQTREDVRGALDFEGGPVAKVTGSYGHAAYTHTEFESPGNPGTVFNSDGWEARGDLVQRERNGWNGAVGVQTLSRTFAAVGAEAFVPTTDISEAGIYTVQRLDRTGWGLEGGLRYDRRTLNAVPLGQTKEVERDFGNWSGSIAGFLKPNPDLFLGLSLAHNERAPSEVELFADGVHVATAAYETGDRTLDNETVNTLEATLHYAADAVRAELHVYVSKYDGFIDERPTGADFVDGARTFAIFQFVQTGATFKGFEAEGGYDVWRRGDRTVSLEGVADMVQAETDLGPAARIPPWSATGRLVYRSTPVDATLEVRHVAEQNRLADFELGTNGYTLVNVSANWRPLADRNVTLFAEARNLTSEEAREHVSFLKDFAPLPGRNLRAGISYRF